MGASVTWSEIIWSLDDGDAQALLTFLSEALENLYFEPESELEQRLKRWVAELQELRTQRARYDALLQPSMEVLLT
jgi:hypothetical protein